MKRTRNKIAFLNQIMSEVRREGKVSISILAIKYGYSPHYFKYAIIPTILELANDIRLVKEGQRYFLIAEPDSEVERVLSARPADE